MEDTVKELVKYEKIEVAEHMLERGKLTKEEIAVDCGSKNSCNGEILLLLCKSFGIGIIR